MLKLLEAYPLADVLVAGKRLMTVRQKFPMAADWVMTLDAMLAASRTTSPTTADVRQMSTTELDVYASAEAARWEGGPCGCAACVTAGSRPIRFVPTCASADTCRAGVQPADAAGADRGPLGARRGVGRLVPGAGRVLRQCAAPVSPRAAPRHRLP